MNRLTRVLVFGALFVFPVCANAGIIGIVNLTEYYSSPTGSVTFPSAAGNYYLDYDVKLNGVGPSEAFCVEDADGPGSGVTKPYTLITIDSGLTAYGLNASKYLAAAWVANYYLANLPDAATEAEKAAAQIAVWEIIFDYNNFNLSSGNFKSNVYVAEAQAILALLPTTLPATGGRWVLAVNPVLTGGGVTEGVTYQNYLVQYVPEPGILILLGIAVSLIAAVSYGIRKP